MLIEMDNIEWTIVNEGQLLDAMVGHKPVGVNKHFQMALICEKFGNNINKDVDPERIWQHLGTMYNLEALDENETIPFPNHEREFSLPDDDFGELMSAKEEYKANYMTKFLKETPNIQYREGNVSTKDMKKESDKNKSAGRNRNSNGSKQKTDETPKSSKRPLRGSSRMDDGGSNGNSSPIPSKRRRLT